MGQIREKNLPQWRPRKKSTKKTLKNHYLSCFLLFGVVPKYHLYWCITTRFKSFTAGAIPSNHHHGRRLDRLDLAPRCPGTKQGHKKGATRMSMAIVSWVATYLAYLRDLQPTYLGVIIYLLSSMDILAETCARGFHAAALCIMPLSVGYSMPTSQWVCVEEPFFQHGAFTVSF